MQQNIEEEDERIVNEEFSYLLHIRKKGKEYQRVENQHIGKEFKELMNGYKQYDYNHRVLVELIETGYVQDALNIMNKSDYPKFLITILKESDKNFVKESVCRMIIKYFGKKKSSNNDHSAGPISG